MNIRNIAVYGPADVAAVNGAGAYTTIADYIGPHFQTAGDVDTRRLAHDIASDVASAGGAYRFAGSRDDLQRPLAFAYVHELPPDELGRANAQLLPSELAVEQFGITPPRSAEQDSAVPSVYLDAADALLRSIVAGMNPGDSMYIRSYPGDTRSPAYFTARGFALLSEGRLRQLQWGGKVPAVLGATLVPHLAAQAQPVRQQRARRAPTFGISPSPVTSA